jgi:predicted Kef-type K+ transport protein
MTDNTAFDNLKNALDEFKQSTTYRLAHNYKNSTIITDALSLQSRILVDLERSISVVHNALSAQNNSSTYHINNALLKFNDVKTAFEAAEKFHEQIYQENIKISAQLMEIGNFNLYDKHASIQSNLLKGKQNFNELAVSISLLQHHLNQLLRSTIIA